MQKRVSVIVPVYNEQKTVVAVLKTLVDSKYIDEVIVVNDCSTDKTLERIQEVQGVKLINFKKNHGKAYAIAKGVEKATGDIVLFVDADLIGFSDNSVQALVEPLQKNTHDVVLANRSGMLEYVIFRPLTGERAYFKKDLLLHLPLFKERGYGLELYLNYAFREKRIKLIHFKDVVHLIKHQKQSMGVVKDKSIAEAKDLFREFMHQKNRVDFFYYSYLYPFYTHRKRKKIM